MKYSKMLTVLALTLTAIPATSFAEMGYVSSQTNLRAGPATEYPCLLYTSDAADE